MCSVPSAIQNCPILSLRDSDLAKKRQTPRIERHFRGSNHLHIFIKLRMQLYAIVACAFKRKSYAARVALNLTAETQPSSVKVRSIGTTEQIRTGSTPAHTSPFIGRLISSGWC